MSYPDLNDLRRDLEPFDDTELEIEDLPLKVVPDWDHQLRRAEEVCRLVDTHLDYEARGRILRDAQDFHPTHLCPEQRVQMSSDLYGATR